MLLDVYPYTIDDISVRAEDVFLSLWSADVAEQCSEAAYFVCHEMVAVKG